MLCFWQRRPQGYSDMADEKSELKKKIVSLLKRPYTTKKAVKILLKPENQHFVEEESAVLVVMCFAAVRNHIQQHGIKYNNKVLIKRLPKIPIAQFLYVVVDRGNPKAVFDALVSEIQDLSDFHLFDAVIQLLYKPLEKALFNLPGREVRSMEPIFAMLYIHLSSKCSSLLEAPSRITELRLIPHHLFHYLHFFEPFVEEVSLKNSNCALMSPSQVQQQREMLQIYLLKLFHLPLAYCNLHDNFLIHRDVIIYLAMIFVYLDRLCCRNYYLLFDLKMWNAILDTVSPWEFDAERDYVLLALGSLAHIMVVYKLTSKYGPLVYRHVYIFQKFVPFALKFCHCHNHGTLIFKGLILLKTLLQKVQDKEFTHVHCPLDLCLEITLKLLCIVKHSTDQLLYYSVCNFIGDFIPKMHPQLCFDYLISLVSCSHSLEKSIAISLYKDCLVKSWDNDNVADYFKGPKLQKFLTLALYLKDGANTDVWLNHTQINGVINLIYCIVDQDLKTHSKSCVWSMISAIVDGFAEPSLQAIAYTKELYKGEFPRRAANEFSVNYTTEISTTSIVLQKTCESFSDPKFSVDSLDKLSNKLTHLVERLIFHSSITIFRPLK